MNHFVIIFLLVITPILAIALAVLGVMTVQTNLIGWFLIFVGILYPLGLIVVYFIRKRKFWVAPPADKTKNEETGDRSFWLVSLGMIASFYFPPLEFLYFGIPSLRNQWVQILGLIILMSGVTLFIWARRTLGTAYSGHISTVEGQKLVQNGPYSVIRHPGYASYLLICTGICIGYTSLAGLISIGLLLIPGLVYRIRVEEKILASHFGYQYTLYQYRTSRFIPWVW